MVLWAFFFDCHRNFLLTTYPNLLRFLWMEIVNLKDIPSYEILDLYPHFRGNV